MLLPLNNGVTLIGKSLGTLALGHLLTTQGDLTNTTFIWLTPLFRHEVLGKQILSTKHRALFVIGTKDPHYNPDVLREVESKTSGESLVIENANHSLEVDGVRESIAVIQQYMSKVTSFLEKS